MTSSDSAYRLNYSRRRLGDFDLSKLGSEVRSGNLSYEEVDFSQNELSSGGLKAVLDICKRCPKLRVLKLFKNRIDDSGAEGLADLCRVVLGIEEIHLSHNHFTAVGVEILVTAAEQARKPNALPLWLRLEQNDVAEPEATFDNLQNVKHLSVCKRVDEVSCTVRICCRKHKVHLPFFHLQRQPRYGFRREEVAPAAPAPHPQAPVRSVPVAPRPASNGNAWNANAPSGDARRADTTEGVASLRQGGGTAWGSPLMAPPSANPAGLRGKEMETTYTGHKWTPETSCRASLVLDRNGLRRMLPEQLEAEDAGNDFVCHLCHFVMIRPVVTRCSHLFCDPCFRNWVADQVKAHKQGPAAHEPVPLIPCPICNEKLRKADITPMSQAEAPAAILLQRRRNNLQIRCVHHMDHFKHSFGKDAERVNRDSGVTCQWIGDPRSYEEHIRKCQVERRLETQGGAITGEAATRLDGRPEEPRSIGGPGRQSFKVSEPAAEPEPAAAVPSDQEEVRVAKFDYQSGDQAQLPLLTNDLVKVFKVTSTGWAAGVRLCPTTMQEVGDPGWFPEGYLHPRNYMPSG